VAVKEGIGTYAGAAAAVHLLAYLSKAKSALV
jgi:hypothetical protein